MQRSKGAGKKKANVKLSEQIYQLLKRDIIERNPNPWIVNSLANALRAECQTLTLTDRLSK